MKTLLYNLFYFIFDKKFDTLTPNDLDLLIKQIEVSDLNPEMKLELLEYAKHKTLALYKDAKSVYQLYYELWTDLVEKEKPPIV